MIGINEENLQELFSINTSSDSTSIEKNKQIDVGYWYMCTLFISPFLVLLDVFSDMILAYQYYIYYEQAYFFLLTIFLVIFTFIVLNAFNIRMYVLDEEPSMSKKFECRTIILILPLAPIVRYIEAFIHCVILKTSNENSSLYKKHYESLLLEDTNLALLRIMECFLESVPQLIIQLTIIFKYEGNTLYSINNSLPLGYLYLSSFISAINTAWTFAMYNRSIRFVQKKKENIKWIGSIVQFFWFFFTSGSRILSISLVASIAPYGTFVAVIIHWSIMTFWLNIFEKTWFCATTSPINNSFKNLSKIGSFLFDAIIGVVYIFTYLSINESQTKIKYIFYYSLFFIENIIAIVVWNISNVQNLSFLIHLYSVIPICMFFVGISFMILYYKYYHPFNMHHQHEYSVSNHSRRIENCKMNKVLDVSLDVSVDH